MDGSGLASGKWMELICEGARNGVAPLVAFDHLKGLPPAEVLSLAGPFFETGARLPPRPPRGTLVPARATRRRRGPVGWHGLAPLGPARAPG